MSFRRSTEILATPLPHHLLKHTESIVFEE